MEEKIVVKVLCGSKLFSTHEFSEYDRAFAFARNKVLLGYNCLILRNMDGKSWLKYWLKAPETI